MKAIDLTNQVFARLTVQKDDGHLLICLCSCGKTCEVKKVYVRTGTKKSCGCLRSEPQAPDLTGQRFNKLLVLSRAQTKGKRAYWNCLCDCGKECVVMGKTMRSADTSSCGCLLREWQKNAASIAFNKPDGEASRHQIFLNYKRQAALRNLPFELTEEQFSELTKGDCFYCGAPPSQIHLHTNRRKTDTGYVYNGVDRMDNTKGYAVDNCVPCCGTHNFMKKKLSAEAFIEACKAVAEHQNEERRKTPLILKVRVFRKLLKSRRDNATA